MPTSLSVVENPSTPVTPSSSAKETTPTVMDEDRILDFIGSDRVVKDLFALPYATDQPISVAVHNLEGTLLIDAEHYPIGEPSTSYAAPTPVTPSSSRDTPVRSTMPSKTTPTEHKTQQIENDADDDVSTALVAISSMDIDSEALTIVASALVEARRKEVASRPDIVKTDSSLGLPRPDDYINRFIPPTPEPREYLNWKFHDMNLLVGSNALIYRTAETALTVRVEEARDLRSLLQKHEELARSGKFVPDHQYGMLEQQGKPSYADAARRNRLKNASESKANDATKASADDPKQKGTFSAPDLEQVRLQTCIVPAPHTPVGGLLSSAGSSAVVQPGAEIGSQVSPVSTVLDIYLDNIMANVPQLALCLKEKGFIQSVKLLQTDAIPSDLMQSSTLDTSTPFGVVGSDQEYEKMFSPRIMETNASALLRFLKNNCTRDNATYLLRREPGHRNIQLYDISTISSQRQRKWIWWLAMMSYRFANRLRHASQTVHEPVFQRKCRSRQRNLLLNTLDLLEVLADMDSNKHESLVAAVNEQLADTFLEIDADEHNEQESSVKPTTMPPPATCVSTQQPYHSLSLDSLGKAQDFLRKGVSVLMPVLRRSLDGVKKSRCHSSTSEKSQVTVVSVHVDGGSSDSDDDDDGQGDEGSVDSRMRQIIEPVVIQLFGLHLKFVNVSLRLAEIHLRNYYSSSAMQALRSSARGIADTLFLVQLLEGGDSFQLGEWLATVQLQFTWLWEHCGHFSRSFAADGLWRDRGHASGDDVVSVLQDAEAAFASHKHMDLDDPLLLDRFIKPRNSLSAKSRDHVNLHSLSGVVDFYVALPKAKSRENFSRSEGLLAAQELLHEQRVLPREHRQVLVAACVAYSKAIESFRSIPFADQAADDMLSGSDFLGLLQQRLGDACNETGKLMLNELRSLLTLGDAVSGQADTKARIASAFLGSAQFWFLEGLSAFEQCRDLRNLSLLRCNLAQSYKLRANTIFSPEYTAAAADGPTHAEACLQEAANHLMAAHESLGERSSDPMTWDMVSDELASTFLVLGVRRRQSLIGSGIIPVITQALRLSPGKEHSIVDPIERARVIYEQLGNHHQAAAAHYQLALFFSKVWTCQLNEAKTREKLGAALQHFNAAHAFFSRSVRGNEVTLCLLCTDLSSLYAAVGGEECTMKAILACLDSMPCFSKDAVDFAMTKMQSRAEWFSKMETLAIAMEERVFKLLRSLVKLEEGGASKGNRGKYKELYRAGLRAKVVPPQSMPMNGQEEIEKAGSHILTLYTILDAIAACYKSSEKSF